MTSGARATLPVLFPATHKSLKCAPVLFRQILDIVMEDLNEINFQCIIEGQNYEESLKKILSISSFTSRSLIHSFTHQLSSIPADIPI